MSVPFTCQNGNFTFVLNGEVFYLDKTDPVYGEVVSELEYLTEDELQDLLTQELTPAKVENEVCGVVEDLEAGVTVDDDGNVRLDGELVHGAIAKKVREFSAVGLPYANLLRFLERVSDNPSYGAQQELFDFLENQGLPITEDGCFLAYKAVRSDYMDKYSGTIDNSPGKVVRMARAKVDDNRARHCSKGLHCGALDYISWYGGGNDHIVVVKVDPVNVVSVPTDCQCQKCRVCEYEVLRDFEGEYNKPLVDARGEYDKEDVKPCKPDLSWADNAHRNEDDEWDEGDVESCDCCCDDEDDSPYDDYRYRPHGGFGSIGG